MEEAKGTDLDIANTACFELGSPWTLGTQRGEAQERLPGREVSESRGMVMSFRKLRGVGH